MPSFKYFNPVRQYIGEHAIDEVTFKNSPINKALIVVSEGMSKSRFEALHKVTKFCEKRAITPIIFDEISQILTPATVEKGAQMMRDFNCNLVIGVGGGKTLDAAKLIALLARQEDLDSLKSWVKAGSLVTSLSAPFKSLLVPTTLKVRPALSQDAYLHDPAQERFIKLNHEALYASILVADFTYLKSLDSSQKNSQKLELFIDAFETLRLESYPYQTIHSVEALRLMKDEDSNDETWLQASILLAQNAHEKTPLIHYLIQAFQSLHPELPHGLVIADLMIPYYEMLAQKGHLDDAVERLLKACGIDSDGLSTEAMIRKFIQELESLKQALDLEDVDLKTYGLDETHISDYMHHLKGMIPSMSVLSDDELYDLLETMLV